MIEDSFKLTGQVHLVLTGPEGELKDERLIKNLVVTGGKGYITNRMVGTTDGVMTQMAVGTGSTAAVAANVAMEALLNAKSTTSFSATRVTDTTANDAIDYVTVFGTGSWVGAITEAGLFNAADLMLCRTTFAAINKATGDTLTITWHVKTTAS